MTKLRTLRTALKLKPYEVVKSADVPYPTLNQLENGRMKVRSGIQCRLAAALGVRPEDLFDVDGWPIPADGAATK